VLRITNATRGTVLGNRIRVADGVISRFVGLLGTSKLADGNGLLIHPSQGVHTLGMLYSIDILFLDRRNRVVGLRHSLKPFRMTSINWSARSVLELPAGAIIATQTEIDDELELTRV
jgi:uncharacterized protein